MTYISLLRGINVSGQKKIVMKDLKVIYESLGYKCVITYIQSGNVIFNSDESVETIIVIIEDAIKNKYGFEVPVEVRTLNDFENIIKNCPFFDLDLVEEGTRMMVTFLDNYPKEEHIKKLMSYVKEPERLVIEGREAYLHCPNGYGKTKLSNNFLENKLKVRATTRNWKSVNNLHVLAKENE